MPVTLPDYNITPSPQTGAGPYGAVPGNIAIPPSTWQQLDLAAPGLTGLTPTALAYTGAAMRGQLTTPEQRALQDAAAAWGVSMGQPLTSPYGITTNKWDTSRLLATMNREKQGLADYQSLLGNIGALQTPQALAADIASRNATMAAAPNPTAAFQAMLDAWMTKFNAAQAAANANRVSTGGTPRTRTTASPPIVGGPSAGTGVYSTPSPAFSMTATGGGGSLTPKPAPTPAPTPLSELDWWQQKEPFSYLTSNMPFTQPDVSWWEPGTSWNPLTAAYSPSSDIGSSVPGTVYDFFEQGYTPDYSYIGPEGDVDISQYLGGGTDFVSDQELYDWWNMEG